MLFIFFLSVFTLSIREKQKETEDKYPQISVTPTIPFGYNHYSTYFYSQFYESSSPFAESRVFSQRNIESETDFDQPEEQDYYLYTVEPQIMPTAPPTKDDEL